MAKEVIDIIWVVSSICLGLALAGAIFYFTKSLYEKEKTKTALEENKALYQQQLRALVAELTLTEEHERRRIAGELHDRIGVSLATVKMFTEMLLHASPEKPFSKDPKEIASLLDQIIQETRSLTFELSPPILYELGFKSAMSWLTEKFKEKYGLNVEYEDDGNDKPIGEAQKIVLFQSVRELLMNTVKHSKASRVIVSTKKEDDKMLISVEDNGVGFDASHFNEPEKLMKGFGIFHIKERITELGGEFRIESKPGASTKISLSVPLEKNTEKGMR